MNEEIKIKLDQTAFKQKDEKQSLSIGEEQLFDQNTTIFQDNFFEKRF